MKRVTVTFQVEISDEEAAREFAPVLEGETSLDRANREFSADEDQRVLSITVEDVIAAPALPISPPEGFDPTNGGPPSAGNAVSRNAR